MSLQDIALHNHLPVRSSRQMTMVTPPRNSILSTTPNSSPTPRIPLGRSPQRASYYRSQAEGEDTRAAPTEGDTAGRSSVDSAAIFSIYSMYGSENGSTGGPAPVPVQTAARRESHGPSRLASSFNDSSRASTPSVYEAQSSRASHSISGYDTQARHGQHQHDPATNHVYHPDHHHLSQRPRHQTQEQRTSQVFPSSFQTSRRVAFDTGDTKFGSSTRAATTAANSVSPYISSYNKASVGVNGNEDFHRSSSAPNNPSRSPDDGRRADDNSDEDDSLTLDIDIGSTVAGSAPSSPTTPSSKRTSMFFSSPSKIVKKLGKAKSTPPVQESDLPYFDTGVMPSVPPPPAIPSAWSGAKRAENGGTGPRRNSYAKDDFGGILNGALDGTVDTRNSNRMSMSNWLPDPSTFISRQPNGVRPASNSTFPQQPTESPLQLERQPPASPIPSVVLAEQPPALPPLQHSLSTSSTYSYTSSAYATPSSVLPPNATAIIGEPRRSGSLESSGTMHSSNGPNLWHHQSSLSSSRRNSPSPSHTPVPPSSYSANNQYSNPVPTRRAPSPAPSRTGSLAAPPSIVYPEPQPHSPHSSLSHNSTQSHQSYGASSVVTKDTAMSAMTGTTATTSGSGVEQAAPPLPVYMQQQQSQTGVGSVPPPGRVSQASSSYSNSQAHQSYTSSTGHRSVGFGSDVPKFDKDLPQMPSPIRGSGVGLNRGSGQNGSGMERRPSPVPSLNVNGSPHHSLTHGGGSMRESAVRQGRLVPVGLGVAGAAAAVGSLSPSLSQQSTATTATTGTSATVSSTGATTANSTPDPNAAGQSRMMMSLPHASLTPHRSLSSMRDRVNSTNSPHHSVISRQGSGVGIGVGSSMKAHSTPSLVPSMGEDLDAFHVRNTYAQLEVSGVKGDGYEEGVERTRARVGSSVSPSPSIGGADTSASAEDVAIARARRTKSQVLADAAIADDNEKKRELEPKELQILGSLDRYGFFTVPSHDRLLLVPSQPLLKPLPFSPVAAASATPPASKAPPSPIQYPASGASATPRTLSALPPVLTPGKENARISKWGRMLMPQGRDEGGNVQAWRIRPGKVAKLRRRTYKGVPDRWRAAAWEVMMTAYSSAAGEGGAAHTQVGSVPVETTLAQISSATAASWGVKDEERMGREYRDALEKPSSYDIQIDLDVPRTISGHIMFRTRYGAGQRSLFHVLHSFSLRCPSCGYVQGMGPIAATLLSYMSPSLAYTSLVRLHDAYSLHSVFAPGFPGLLEAIYVQERITQTTMPSVYAAFQKHMISTTSYATKWYITLFANSVPFQTQLRLWDVFLLEGYDVYIAVAIAIVWVYKDHITSASANFETVLSLLSGFFVPEDENMLLGWIEKMLGDRRVRIAMKDWRKEWRELVREGKEGTALL